MATISSNGEKIALSYASEGGFFALNILDIYNCEGEAIDESANINGVIENPSFSLDSSLVGYVGTNQVVIQKVDNDNDNTPVIFDVTNPNCLSFKGNKEIGSCGWVYSSRI